MDLGCPELMNWVRVLQKERDRFLLGLDGGLYVKLHLRKGCQFLKFYIEKERHV